METELVVRARSGDHGAFALIVASIARRFHGVAYAILRDRTLAEDAAQAALVAIWRDLPRLREPRRFDAWANRILINACYREGQRARWRRAEIPVGEYPVRIDFHKWQLDPRTAPPSGSLDTTIFVDPA